MSDSVCIMNKFTDLLLKEEEIGAGGFGSVYRCVHALDDKEYAVKKVLIENNEKLDWYLREAKALSSMEHKNVVRYYQSWTDVTCDGFSDEELNLVEEIIDPLYLFVQMEYCPRTLESMLKENPIIDHLKVLDILTDLGEGLDYIHENGYLHRDFALKNIFIGKNGQVKIGDFGLAKQVTDPNADYKYCSHSPHSTTYGAGFHRSPELKQNHPYTQKSDLYALGITYLEMLLVHLELGSEKVYIVEGIKKGVFPDGWEYGTALLGRLLAESPKDIDAREVFLLIKDIKNAEEKKTRI